MCEKNLERKQLSLFPFDEDDLNEETIVDDDITNDNSITDDKDNIVVDSSKRKKRSKKTTSKSCKTCHRNIIENENRDMLRFTNTFHQVSAKNYCRTHEASHSNHKCKPHWCGDCGFLLNYEIHINSDNWRDEIQEGK